ncbi:transcription factor bHLH36-like isoform X1 [Salvia hispanica]|uniref:transcription factor bHLH36-like isoform X1 n=1 Tax=Salvia hispanica TaxID=49212 RepID=UPI002009470E|nr:transcription factor bHLH36-like isoform X1 [Salvia hispanica]
MLPFQQSYDLGFGTHQGFQIQDTDPGFGTPLGFQIQDDFLENNMIHFLVENKLIDFSAGKNVEEVSKTTDLETKKDIHREVERKRRKELSDLYASLRSHLPHHKIKGKQSVCDHVQAATSHIIRMEKNIQELEIRRNKLKIWLNKSSVDVDVKIVSDGIMEILISNSIADNLGLSRVLAELRRNELDVVSSVSTRTKDRFVHKIQAEAVGKSCRIRWLNQLQPGLDKTPFSVEEKQRLLLLHKEIGKVVCHS